MAKLTGHNAIVRTATVEIKTMAIGQKQVTLAVFRQLKDEDVIDMQTGQLRGVPWGTVNYFWGDCKEGSHLHVVWQQGMELRRCCLPKDFKQHPAHPRQVSFVQAAADLVANAARLALAARMGHCPPSEAERAGWETAKHLEFTCMVGGQPHRLHIPWGPALCRINEWYRPGEAEAMQVLSVAYRHCQGTALWGRPPVLPPVPEAFWNGITKAAASVFPFCTLPEDTGQWEAFFRTLAEEGWPEWTRRQHRYATLCTRWREHYAALAALDQLFIAV